MLGEGTELAEVCRQLEVSEAMFHRWRHQYGGMKAEDVKRLKEFERENVRLKAIVADQALKNRALKEIAKETSEPGSSTSGGRDGLRLSRGQRALGVPSGRGSIALPAL